MSLFFFFLSFFSYLVLSPFFCFFHVSDRETVLSINRACYHTGLRKKGGFWRLHIEVYKTEIVNMIAYQGSNNGMCFNFYSSAR